MKAVGKVVESSRLASVVVVGDVSGNDGEVDGRWDRSGGLEFRRIREHVGVELVTTQLVDSMDILDGGGVSGGVVSLALIGDGKRRGSRVGGGLTLVDGIVAIAKRTTRISRLGPARKSVQETRRGCV